MATDTAFAVALIVMLGRHVPVELRIFLTAATIVDDIAAILVVALFYSHELHPGYLLTAAAIVGLLALFNRARIYRVTPYLVLGVLLWVAIFLGGLHATLAGVLLALFIPTRDPSNARTLMAQANAILVAEARRSEEVLHHGPSAPAIPADRALRRARPSPADRLLRTVSLRSNYVVLPIFALANAGVAVSMSVVEGHGRLMFAIISGLVLGKPLGMVAASALAVRLRLATKSDQYSWSQLLGAGLLSGIGFTMSLFIAGEAFPGPSDFAAAKIAVFVSSAVAALLGTGWLWYTGRREAEG
jgi:NhaA family Na+:H+ antiporter